MLPDIPNFPPKRVILLCDRGSTSMPGLADLERSLRNLNTHASIFMGEFSQPFTIYDIDKLDQGEIAAIRVLLRLQGD